MRNGSLTPSKPPSSKKTRAKSASDDPDRRQRTLALTAEGASSSHARWSPDGKFIAFLSARDEGKTQVRLLNRLGGEAERLTNTPPDVEDFAWSLDGRQPVLILRDARPKEREVAQQNKDKAVAHPATAAESDAKDTTPTLFMGGQVDWNVPILGSEQMYQALKRLGRLTELVV